MWLFVAAAGRTCAEERNALRQPLVGTQAASQQREV
jgi:hypothetical protein